MVAFARMWMCQRRTASTRGDGGKLLIFFFLKLELLRCDLCFEILEFLVVDRRCCRWSLVVFLSLPGIVAHATTQQFTLFAAFIHLFRFSELICVESRCPWVCVCHWAILVGSVHCLIRFVAKVSSTSHTICVRCEGNKMLPYAKNKRQIAR